MRKVPVTCREINGKSVSGKECTRCITWKPLEDFHKSGHTSGGRQPKCKTCSSEIAKKYKKTDGIHRYIYTRDGIKYKVCSLCEKELTLDKYLKRKKGGVNSRCKECESMSRRKGTGPKPIHVVLVDNIPSKECRSCGEVKKLTNYSKSTRSVGGVRSSCKDCERIKHKKYREENREARIESIRKWRLTNPDKQKASKRKWTAKNPHKNQLYLNNRKAMRCKLVHSLTDCEWNEALKDFEGVCSLSETGENITMDHFIPISIGHGGTLVGNVYPLSSELNFSKWNRNPFEWFEEYGVNHGVKRDIWDRLVVYLASKNNLTPYDFKNYVNWCFDNTRSSEEILEIENSVDVWRREAVND